MKNITGSLFLLLSVFCLLSCSNNNDEEIIEKKDYELSSIKWILREGDGEEFFEVETPELIFQNTGNTTKDVVLNSRDGIEETSQFNIDESILPYLPEEETTFSIPETFQLSSSVHNYLLGGRTAPFQNEKAILPPNLTIEDTISLAPSCELRSKSIFKMKKITATYCVSFVEKDGTDRYEKEGKWVGVFIIGENCETVIVEIK